MYKALMPGALLCWMLSGCGGGGGSSSAPPATPYTGEITGQLVAPNGVTPIPGATVYIESPGASARVLPRGADNGACPAPQTQSEWTCSGTTGEFSFDVTDLPPGSTLHAEKGAWTLSLPLRFTAQSTGALGAVAFRTDTASGAAHIAVVTGHYDNIEYLLAKMGLGEVEENGLAARAHIDHAHAHAPRGAQSAARSLPLKLGSEKFDLYDGNGSLPAQYPEVDALFSTVNGQVRLYEYDIIYINCGADEPDASGWRDLLGDYVAQGGTLYVTDQSSTWLEGFSDYLQPALSWGSGVGELAARVVDAPMAGWLGGVTCAGGACITDGQIHIEGMLFGWHLAQPLPGAVTPLVRADVSEAGYPDETDAIMTLSFRHGQGQVVYSSYHVSHDAPEEGYLPQERVLEYLFFSQTP
ncbi:hypothetical protein A167_00328 [Alcanivorax sp. S71-1-4]|uniref:hypothetical protein n=1 Tax=Alcanivorax sp. S71-1-4 TaxID=1177159 RepID=UPI001358FF42|nr:hypothetical protein [Alcanivorax sp. S71-1-4]KAF0810841.1 hypothetical protein A167_00328 [Alcanivorax sp. S71-1-4]